MRINPTNSTEHICGWISSCKTELLTSVTSLNMKKWMFSDGKLCSHSVKRKIQNTNTEWRNNISKVSYTVSIHIGQYHRRETMLWWRTQTPIKKMKTKKYFFRKIYFYFFIFLVRSEYYNTNKSWLSSRKIQRDMFMW